jgi:hypothetical protein
VNTFPAAVLARALGGRKVWSAAVRAVGPMPTTTPLPPRQPARRTSSSEYLGEIVGEIAGPTVKLDSTDGTAPILIPADPGLLVLEAPIR